MSKNVETNMDMDNPLQLAQQRAKKKLKFNLVQTTFLITVFAVILWIHYGVVPLLEEKSQRLKDCQKNSEDCNCGCDCPLQKDSTTKWLEHYDYYIKPFPILSVVVGMLAQAFKFLICRGLFFEVNKNCIDCCVGMMEWWGNVIRFFEQTIVDFFIIYLVAGLQVAFFHGALAVTMCLVILVDYYFVRRDVNYFIDKLETGRAPGPNNPWWLPVQMCLSFVVSYWIGLSLFLFLNE